MNVGDKVMMNDKYYEHINHKNDVFEIVAFGNIGGTQVAYLKGYGAYALDGLEEKQNETN